MENKRKLINNFKSNCYILVLKKKGIASVIAMSLLLVVTIISVISFQGWFEDLSSKIFSEVEVKSIGASNNDLKVDMLVGDKLYIINSIVDNLSLKELTIDGEVCILSKLRLGINEINVSDCLDNLSTSTPSIVLITDKTIIDKQVFLSDQEVNLENGIIPSYSDKRFISVWDTTKIMTGSSNSNQIKLPLYDGGSYNFNVSWGDGSVSIIKSWNDVNVTHTYSSAKEYELIIDGEITGFRFNSGGDKSKIINIKNWGSLNVGNEGAYFSGCYNLQSNATDILNLSGTTNLSWMFNYAKVFNGDLSKWDVSKVTDMHYMFNSNYKFKGDLSKWDVSKVSDMSYMFNKNYEFNGDLSKWNVSNVMDMKYMFSDAKLFSSDLSKWDVSKVSDMKFMFDDVNNFESDLSKWNVSKVTDMRFMFYKNYNFTSDLSKWDVSKVTDMEKMFYENYYFDSDLSQWDVSNVIDMDRMFFDNYVFNGNISNWNVSKVMDISYMFNEAKLFNQDLSKWDVSSVINIYGMFYGASSFESDLSQWDVSSANNFFNMFYNASSFNSNLSKWDVSNVIVMTNMLDLSGISVENYSNTLIGWNSLPSLKSGITLDVGSIKFNSGANSARQNIIDSYSWTINDGGLE